MKEHFQMFPQLFSIIYILATLVNPWPTLLSWSFILLVKWCPKVVTFLRRLCPREIELWVYWHISQDFFLSIHPSMKFDFFHDNMELLTYVWFIICAVPQILLCSVTISCHSFLCNWLFLGKHRSVQLCLLILAPLSSTLLSWFVKIVLNSHPVLQSACYLVTTCWY